MTAETLRRERLMGTINEVIDEMNVLAEEIMEIGTEMLELEIRGVAKGKIDYEGLDKKKAYKLGYLKHLRRTLLMLDNELGMSELRGRIYTVVGRV
jgi:hypothetical protein